MCFCITHTFLKRGKELNVGLELLGCFFKRLEICSRKEQREGGRGERLSPQMVFISSPPLMSSPSGPHPRALPPVSGDTATDALARPKIVELWPRRVRSQRGAWRRLKSFSDHGRPQWTQFPALGNSNSKSNNSWADGVVCTRPVKPSVTAIKGLYKYNWVKLICGKKMNRCQMTCCHGNLLQSICLHTIMDRGLRWTRLHRGRNTTRPQQDHNKTTTLVPYRNMAAFTSCQVDRAASPNAGRRTQISLAWMLAWTLAWMLAWTLIH